MKFKNSRHRKDKRKPNILKRRNKREILIKKEQTVFISAIRISFIVEKKNT